MDRFVILMLGVLVGTLPSYVGDLGAEAGAEEKVKPVYVLVSAEVKSAPEGLKAYSDAARPMAMAAGLEVVVRIESVSDELVFEGSWSHAGGITIERFESMAAFESFWYSEVYQAAISLREGKVDINFVVAVPAV